MQSRPSEYASHGKMFKCLLTEVTNQPITSQRLNERGGTLMQVTLNAVNVVVGARRSEYFTADVLGPTSQLSENGPKKRTDPASSSCVEGNTVEM